MPNFSAYENVMITAMIQGVPYSKARLETEELFKRLDLPVDDRPISSYSGGQRQRLAFARAILPNFSVLFGDEPTGNLDARSANDLMRVLLEIVKEKESTAVIVSHDMQLAVDYSDMIVQIQKKDRYDGAGFYGVINERSIYRKVNGEWFSQKEKIDGEKLCDILKKDL